MALNVPHYSKKEIIALASDFCKRYDMVLGNAYLIDEAIELGLEMDISPEPRLYLDYDIDAFTTGNFTRIVIDDSLLQRSPARYRFTLAHEVGHYVLHRDTLSAANIDTVSDWMEFHKSLSDNDHKQMERQCDIFASYLLMPDTKINAFLEEKFTQMKDYADYWRAFGRQESDVKSIVRDKFAKEISGVFWVSVEAAEIRIRDNSRLLRVFN